MKSGRGQTFFDFDAPLVVDPVQTPVKPKTNGHNGHVAKLKAQRGLFDAPPESSEHQAENHLPDAGKMVPPPPAYRPLPEFSHGLVAKAKDILAAIRTLQAIEREQRSATDAEKDILARFCGFGPVALHLFPDPITDKYKDASWEKLGHELKDLLTTEDYDSAKRTTFNAFYTSPVVMAGMHNGLARLGLPSTGLVLEPGCGIARFAACAPVGMRFVGVELDSLSARIAKALHPDHDIRNQNFRDSKLPPIDGVIGNVPFADIKLDWKGQKFSLHDYFFAKSVDALKPGGVLALVTSHFTLDKQNAAIREHLAEQADFLGAIRLPSDAFKNEGTSVVTDIIFLHKRAPGEPAKHVDDWLSVAPIPVEGVQVPINRYFHTHPEMVLGTWSRKNLLYDDVASYSIASNGDLAEQLRVAIGQLPGRTTVPKSSDKNTTQNGTSNGYQESDHIAAPSFIPPQNFIGEGSFFIKNHSIYQIIDGQGQQVVYGGKSLTTHGALTGRRLAQLIRLRDLARRVLQSQNEDWPEYNRHEARLDLNIAYDSFVRAYGPINKTTISQTKTEGTIRRMPNLVKFREDPDAMLVMSLEEYDEATGKAEKSTIMKKDVVGKTPPVTKVTSAEEGLLVSLNEHGKIDLPFISKLYGKPEAEITDELGNLIYQNPATKEWETADAYLSGNVRQKLKEAEACWFTRNAEALRKVQPEDVLPGDIDANLGAPWIPETDIQAFAADLFGVSPSSIPVAHLKKDALWTVSADYSAERSVPATADYGTSRANGVWLFELALNMKSPTIYDPDPSDPDKRVVNPTETLAAKEKQKLIKEKFKAWAFADPDRAERLTRLYNDTYNNLRPRLFDGSHLTFPGKNPTITLNPHQTAAVWRCMTAGNTLLAHAVGAGKSFEMSAACMKMRQSGLIKKPVVCVPNHLLEQFGREFMHLYPNANLLIATKDDLAKERRKLLTAKIASRDWDAIIITHSSFERIGMSKDYQADFLREQIAEYDDLLLDHAGKKDGAHRNILKSIEKQKAAREEKLRQLLAEDKKDDGLVFDELGVDQLFCDESMAWKNLEAPTKMDRVAGIPSGGSERAFDMFMKARYLDQQHPGHGVVFACGTPITNTMVEMYTNQRFLDPKGLRDRGIEHFDAWAASFGEVVDSMEISPDGKSLRPRSRFARFVNLPELQQMFRSFADVQTADMLNLPRPELEGGKAITIACPMSDEQKEIQDRLVQRYERLRAGGVDPRQDNALAITTDGRKLALDSRMIQPGPDHPHSKINALVENIYSIWQDSAPTKGTQLVFCDMGVNPTEWGFSAYDDVIRKLVAHGIPKEQIENVGDADTDSKKQVLFQKVRQGTVRVLLGSTQKMGMGTNVQKRLVALHHLDAPWKPAEVEQRDGRILRQGNENKQVKIFRYVTEGSFDAYMWQALETKARFIAQVMKGDNVARKAEDLGGEELSYAEVKAIASGNPAVLTLAETDAELKRLSILRKNHDDGQFLARRNIRDLPGHIKRLEERLKHLTSDIEHQDPHAPLVIGSREVPADDALVILGHRIEELPERVNETRRVPLGKFRGLEFGVILNANFSPDAYLQGDSYNHTMLSRNPGPRAVLNAVERLIESYPSSRDSTRKELEIARTQLEDYQERLGRPFEHEAYTTELAKLRDQLRGALSEAPKEGQPSVSELADRMEALRESRVVVDAPQRAATKTSAEEPVTARIKREREAEQRAQAAPLPSRIESPTHVGSFSR